MRLGEEERGAELRGGGGAGGVSPEAEGAELECGICCMPYDRCGRAPRRLGGARGSWKPSRCRHVICSACVCQLAREGWWERVTCPYCRAVTALRERGHPLVAGVRRAAARRRLVLPPIDVELWQRVVRLQEAGKEEEHEEEEQEEASEDDDDGQWRLWRALKRLLKGGGRPAHAREWRGRGRGGSLPVLRTRRRAAELLNPYGSEMKDLALMNCYII